MSDQNFINGLQNGFEADRPKCVPAVYWLEGGRTICVRYSTGRLYYCHWQTPQDRESIRADIARQKRQGAIDYDEAYDLWAAACEIIADRLEVVDVDEDPVRPYDWQLTVLNVAGLAIIAAIVWLILDSWSW